MDEQLRFKVTADSELPKVISDLETLIRKQNDLGEENSRTVRTMNANMQSHQAQYTSLGNVVTGVRNLIGVAFGVDEVKKATESILDLKTSYEKVKAPIDAVSDLQDKYNNALKTLESRISKASDEDLQYQRQIEARAAIQINKIAAIQQKAQELSDKQSSLADKERVETESLLKKKEELVDKINKINDTYSQLGVRTEKEQNQWDNALKKTFLELDKVEGKIEAMPAKTASENAKIEKQFASLQNQVISASSALSKATNDLEGLGTEARKADSYIGKLQSQIANLKNQRAFAQTEDEVKQINVQLAKMEANLKDVTGGAKKTESAFGSMKNILAGALAYFGISEIIEAIKAVFNLTTTWEKYQTTLKVALGSQDKANQALLMLQSYADKTNYTLDELADTFTKFANRGLVLAKDNLIKVGDVANALGKPFKDLGEAILDINNTERWNELGIKAKTAGDKVSLTFKGVTIEVDKTEQGVLRAVTAFGTLNGVQGQTAEQAKTLGGRMSTLMDGLAGLGREIGQVLTPVFSVLIDASSKVVGEFTKAYQTGGPLRDVIGSLGAGFNNLWGFINELITPLTEGNGLFAQLFGWLGQNSNAMKLFATVMQVAVVGPFQGLILAFREIWQATLLTYNGFQGLIAGLEAVGKALVLDFSGAKASIGEASDYFTKAGQNFSNMKEIYTKTNADFSNSLKAIWEDAKTVAVNVDEINRNLTAGQLKAVELENDRWVKVSSGMKAGTAEYAKAYAEHLENLSKADGTYMNAAVDTEKAKGDKKKEQAFLSAKELAVVVKDVQEQSLKDQLALVDANMKLEIEKINNHKVARVTNEAEAQAAIKEIVAKAEAEKEKLIDESRVKIEATEIIHSTKIVELANKMVSDVKLSEVQRLMNTQLSADERAKIELDTQLKIAEIRKREQEIIKETEQIEKTSYNERIKKVIGFIGSLSSGLSDFANFAIGMVDNMDLISGKTVKTYENQVKNAQAASVAIKILYKEDSAQYADSMVKVQETKRNLTEAEAASSMASLNMAMAVADIMQKVAKAINDKLIETNTAIIESYDTIERVMSDYYDTLIVINKNSLEEQLKDFKGTYDERERIIDEHYNKQSEYAEAKGIIEYQAAYMKLTLEQDSKLKSDMTASDRKQMGQIVANMYAQQALEEEHRIKKLNREIETAEEIRDKKIQALEESRDAEIAAQKVITETVSNELDVLDTKRKQLLDSWLERKLKDLEDDKNLALAQADTEEEKANIIIKYQGLMQAAHDEYKSAELDKTKSVKLATEELKAQESDFVKQKEDETARTIQNINSQTTQMIRDANREIFEAQKQITIAELQGEIAKLKAKRWFMNANRVDSAIATIEGVISQIQGTSFGGGNIGGGASVDGDLGVNEGYVAAGQKADDVAKQAQAAMETTTQILQSALSTTDWLGKLAGEAQNSLNSIQDAKNKATEAVEYAEGTSYVEGIGFPDGIDTVKAKLTKGERVVPEELNRMLGRETPNEALVKGFLSYKELQKKFGKLSIEAFSQLKYSYGSNRLGTTADLKGLEREVRALTDVIRSKPELSISVDANKITVAEKSQQEQHTNYYSNIYNR